MHQICKSYNLSSLRICRRNANTREYTSHSAIAAFYSLWSKPHHESHSHPCLHPFHPVFIALVMALSLVLEVFWFMFYWEFQIRRWWSNGGSDPLDAFMTCNWHIHGIRNQLFPQSWLVRTLFYDIVASILGCSTCKAIFFGIKSSMINQTN
jgi:hypothetical protein